MFFKDLFFCSNIHLILYLVSDLEYRGNETDLEYCQMIFSNIHCNFQLEFYPFDHQLCSINISIVNIHYTKFNYVMPLTGKPDIVQAPPEYVVEKPILGEDVQFKKLYFYFVLKRQISYHLLSTYFPTMLLHFIGFGTLFIQVDDFQDRGTMSLTTLLVLISLYSDTMDDLPVTSYVKFIDIWFMFSITFLTAIILVHLITNNTKKEFSEPLFTKRTQKPKPALKKFSNALILRFAQIFLGGIYILFISTYLSLFIISRNQE